MPPAARLVGSGVAQAGAAVAIAAACLPAEGPQQGGDEVPARAVDAFAGSGLRRAERAQRSVTLVD
jgi:hypothetical protein